MTRQASAPWSTRIVRHGVLEAGQFLAHERNWRVHPTVQQDQMDVVLAEIGFVQEVMVNLRTDPSWGADRGVETLVDGHLRVGRALARGEDTPVPVAYVDLLPHEERAVLATFDPLGDLATTDKEKLGPLAEEVALDFAESELDLAAILGTERSPARGLAHEVKECTCCQKKCRPGCGCYRDERPKKRKACPRG